MNKKIIFRRKNIVTAIIIMLLVSIVGTVVCSETAYAASDSIKISDRKVSSSKVTLKLTAKKSISDLKIQVKRVQNENGTEIERSYETITPTVSGSGKKRTIQYTFLKEGTYKFRIKYADSKGNWSEWITSDRVTYSTAKPTVMEEINVSGEKSGSKGYTLPTPDEKSGSTYYYSKSSITVTCGADFLAKKLFSDFTATWGSSKISYSKKYRDDEGGVVAKFTLSGNKSGKLSFTATNTLGQSTTGSTGITVVLDDTAPVINIESAYSDSSKTIKSDSKVTVTISVTETNFNGATVKDNGSTINASWSGNKATVTLDEGTHQLTVDCTDKAGNKAKTATSATIKVDTTAPTLKISGIQSGESYGNKSKKYPITVTIKDNNSLSASSQTVKLEKYDASTGKWVASGINFTETSDSKKKLVYSISDIEEDGYYRITVKAKDAFGNVVTKENLKSKSFSLKKGKVVGKFYINRNGSYYVVATQDVFGTIQQPLTEDIIIYECNINEIKKKKTSVVISSGSQSEQTLTIGEGGYEFKKSSKEELEAAIEGLSDEVDLNDYEHIYKYTIYASNFAEDGSYYVSVNSTAEVKDSNGNDSMIIKSSSRNSVEINKKITIDSTAPRVVLIDRNVDNIITVALNDYYFNSSKTAPILTIDGQTVALEYDEENSSVTTRWYKSTEAYTGSLKEYKITYTDYAGNQMEATNDTTSGVFKDFGDTGISTGMLAIIASAAVVGVLLIVMIVGIILVKRKK